MEHKKNEQLARDEAKKSKCTNRQVGAVVVGNITGDVYGRGYNASSTCQCNNLNLKLSDCDCATDVIHAEVACLNSITKLISGGCFTMYVTQPPCNNCLASVKAFELQRNTKVTVHVCETFIKFDDDKLRYDLIPPKWETALAEVLTHGAKKYKPNNWQQGDIERYKAAMMRHWNAYRKGERHDPDSGMPHLWHIMTNIGFLITLEGDK